VRYVDDLLAPVQNSNEEINASAEAQRRKPRSPLVRQANMIQFPSLSQPFSTSGESFHSLTLLLFGLFVGKTVECSKPPGKVHGVYADHRAVPQKFCECAQSDAVKGIVEGKHQNGGV
jgi:hypothetical protein